MIHAKRLHHVGIAVRSIEAHRAYYEETLGARFECVETVPDQHVRVAFFLVGNAEDTVRLELIEATDPASPVARFLEKRGEGLHHLAFEVDDLVERLETLRAGGATLIDDRPRTGAHGLRIAFLHPGSTGGVLTEICQPPDGSSEASTAL
jgi:methylmalonyl-CoA/ethylmalonyl-CoA epimerase